MKRISFERAERLSERRERELHLERRRNLVMCDCEREETGNELGARQEFGGRRVYICFFWRSQSTIGDAVSWRSMKESS